MRIQVPSIPVRATDPQLVGAQPARRVGMRPAFLNRLRSVVLLAGSVRPNPLRKAVGRFVLELPIEAQHSLLDNWHQQLAATAVHFSIERLPIRVIVDRTTPMPAATEWNGPCEFRFEQDPFEYRGTGGLLVDLARQYDDDDYLLVANAQQVLFEPLPILTASLSDADADLSMICLADGTPAGLMLVRCGCLHSVPRVGFVDLNEQALPAIARDHDVVVVRHTRQISAPIRTLSSYLDAVRQYHHLRAGQAATGGAFAEDWQATFGIIEPGAAVDPSAVVHDSIVLSGGQVENGALLVRAVVCPEGFVPRGKSAIDSLVTGRTADHLKEPG